MLHTLTQLKRWLLARVKRNDSMSRLGSDYNKSSDQFEAKMLPDVEKPKPEPGGEIDLQGDGRHKIYLHRAQLEIYNWQSRVTYIRAARGFGKSSYIGVHLMKCVLGLRRQLGGFVGASAKQVYTRTMPNVMKVVNSLGYQKGLFWFFGRPPARLRWETPYAEPKNWENVVSFQNGAAVQLLSMAVSGSANGLNLAFLLDDETKYQPWGRVKEEVVPTVRGDFMPESARRVEKKRWGYGTDPDWNPYWLSRLFCSDAGLTVRQREWEKEEELMQTDEVRRANEQIADMLAELKYLEKVNPKMAVQLAQNDNFLKKLHHLRSQSETFWNFSSIENASMLGESWIRDMERSLTEMQFQVQILGIRKTAVKNGFYCNYSDETNTYISSDCETLVKDRFLHKEKGRALDVQNWPTDYETETLDLEEMQLAGEDCSLDLDLDYGSPICIAIDAGTNTNFLIAAQTRMYQGKPSIMVMKEFWVQAPVRLMGLVKQFSQYYKPYLRRNRNKKGGAQVIFYYTPTIKQGGATAYAVEGSEDSRFDKVVIRELESYGWSVCAAEFPVWRHERKYQAINDMFAFIESPSIFINGEDRCDNLRIALETASVVPGSFRKDKHLEKYAEDGIAGNVLQRTDITDAFDDLVIGIKTGAENNKKIGGGLRGRYKNLAGMPR